MRDAMKVRKIVRKMNRLAIIPLQTNVCCCLFKGLNLHAALVIAMLIKRLQVP